MIGNLGMWEILLISLILLLLFGARRLPEIGQSLGKGIKEFKKSVTSTDDEQRELSDRPRTEADPWSRGDDSR